MDIIRGSEVVLGIDEWRTYIDHVVWTLRTFCLTITAITVTSAAY